MRCRVLYRGEEIGEVDLHEGPIPGTVAGPLEPAPAYSAIQAVCRRPMDAMVAALGGPAAFDAMDTDELSVDAFHAYMAAMQDVTALGLQLTDLQGVPVPTAGPVTIQDYTGSATEHLAQAADGAITVGACLTYPGESRTRTPNETLQPTGE